MWAIVVAAGTGERFGSAKQYATLGGRPVAAWSVSAARGVASGVVLVVPPADVQGAQAARCGADVVVAGGPSRSASVRAGLQAVPLDAAVVVVHDAARPLARPALFESVVDALRAHRVSAAVPAIAVSDTLKRLEDDRVVATVGRESLVAVQTPQAFEAAVLRRAHAGCDEATDDAGLVEQLGVEVRVVAGDPRNLKITTPADLALAEVLLDAPDPDVPGAGRRVAR